MIFETIWLWMTICLGLASRSAYHHRKEWHGYVSVLFWTAIATLVIRLFFWEPMKTVGPSMDPTLPQGSLVMVNKQSYGWSLPWLGLTGVMSAPTRLDVVAFRRNDEVYIKRVQARPRDKLTFLPSKGWFVNGIWVAPSTGREHAWLRVQKNAHWTGSRWNIIVPSNGVFVVGDNLSQSSDSREFGLVPIHTVVGQVRRIK